MSKSRLIDSIKLKNQIANKQEKSEILSKVRERKRLSSKEFLKTYNSLWKEGPSISYNNSEVRVRDFKPSLKR